ncbi:MAG: lipase chaperone LimK [Oleiphilaceae bacterium]|jgi:lipase chaperone LimK
MSSTLQKNAFYALVILASLAVITLIMLPSSEPIAVNDAPVTQKIDTINVGIPKTNTIATAWQWEAKPSNDNSQHAEILNKEQHSQAETNASLLFTQESVYKALHAVKIDDNGDIIIDNDALTALNAALENSEFKLDNETLERLQDIIKQGLPGNAGDQTAQIVADYYQFLGAKSEFNTLYESRDDPDRNIENHEAQFNELLALREVYLGNEVADKLFASDNANAQYMFDSMKLEANTNLSEEEKKLLQVEIIERHAEKTINVNNWNERFQSFSADKQHVLNSSLSDDGKRDQLTSLMHQHFSYEELDYVKHLQLDSL